MINRIAHGLGRGMWPRYSCYSSLVKEHVINELRYITNGLNESNVLLICASVNNSVRLYTTNTMLNTCKARTGYTPSFTPVSYTHLDVYKRQYRGLNHVQFC